VICDLYRPTGHNVRRHCWHVRWLALLPQASHQDEVPSARDPVLSSCRESAALPVEVNSDVRESMSSSSIIIIIIAVIIFCIPTTKALSHLGFMLRKVCTCISQPHAWVRCFRISFYSFWQVTLQFATQKLDKGFDLMWSGQEKRGIRKKPYGGENV